MDLDILQYVFFQKALIASFLVSIAVGIIGTFITVKKISLFSGSIAHGSFGGLGLSYFLGFNPLLGALVFSLFGGVTISLIRKSAKKNIDALLTIFWTTGMAIGLIFVFLTPGYAVDLFSFLFGNILLINSSDLVFMFALDTIIILVVVLIYNSLLATLFNEEFAEVRNVKNNLVYLILFILIAITIVMVIKVVGVVLAIALLTIPSASAQLISKKFGNILIISIIISLIITIGGLFLSYYLELQSGPVIVLCGVFVYLSLLIYNTIS